MTRTDAFQTYTMGKRNSLVYLELGNLNAAMEQTRLALRAYRFLRGVI